MAQAQLGRLFFGHDLTFRHAAWLCVIGGVGLSLLGLYAVDLGQSDAPESGLITLSGLTARHAVYLCVGMVAAAMIAAPNYRLVRMLAWPMMWVSLALLVFLLIPFVPTSIVRPRNGARAWIEMGPLDFQPSEIAKIAFVLVMADYLRYRQNHRTMLGLVPPALIAFVPAALITLQPDLGMAMLFAPATFAMLWVAGAKVKHLGLVVLVAMLAAPAAYPLLKPHQKARIVGMIQMMKDPSAGADGINYQSMRSQTLAGAGGATGVSDAKSRALHKFNDLPERHNDMILSVIITRFGLAGGLGVLFLYVLWFTGAYLTAAMCKDGFGQLVIVGFMAIVFAQAMINACMVLGVLPIVGLTLPFVSYGGTSLLSVWGMTGMIFGIAMRRSVRLARPTFEFDEQPYDPLRQTTPQRIAPSLRRKSA